MNSRRVIINTAGKQIIITLLFLFNQHHHHNHGSCNLIFQGTTTAAALSTTSLLSTTRGGGLSLNSRIGIISQRHRRRRLRHEQPIRHCPFTAVYNHYCDDIQPPSPSWNNNNNSTTATTKTTTNTNIQQHLHRRDFLALSTALGSTTPFITLQNKNAHAATPSPAPSSTTPPPPPPPPPFSSTRQYKIITLPTNNLRVILVSDTRALQTSAALTIQKAGQFSDPPSLPGLAHLMEHMVLSASSPPDDDDDEEEGERSLRKFIRRLTKNTTPDRDFEEWLNDDDGSSNGFTAYDLVCFHFALPNLSLSSNALSRFAALFDPIQIARVCRNERILRREIRRVGSELDREEVTSQMNYVTKALINKGHPFGRFSAGSIATLERAPRARGINVGDRLISFFSTHYNPQNAVLVVVAPTDFKTLERWVLPFDKVLSSSSLPPVIASGGYPKLFPAGKREKQIIEYHVKNDYLPMSQDIIEKLSMEWELSLDYSSEPIVTATQIAFILSQIFGRRGPGSLYSFLLRRNWIPPKKIPRILLPLDVSGCQILKLELILTIQGFLNRSAVIAAVYGYIDALRNGEGEFVIGREVLAQFVSVAWLHGYYLAPRPPDAIELAIDAQTYNTTNIISPSTSPNLTPFYHFPPSSTLPPLQKTLQSTFPSLSNPSSTLIIVTAGPTTVVRSRESFIDETIPNGLSPKWENDAVTGARYCYDEMIGLSARMEEFILTKLEEEQLRPIVSNPLIPTVIKPPSGMERRRSPPVIVEGIMAKPVALLSGTSLSLEEGVILLPRGPPISIRCAYVFQLRSTRPLSLYRAVASSASDENDDDYIQNLTALLHGELWKTTFEKSIVDLAELGAPAGLAYDLSFNEWGLRLVFLGIPQNVASYARRWARRLVRLERLLLATMMMTTTAAAAPSNGGTATTNSNDGDATMMMMMADHLSQAKQLAISEMNQQQQQQQQQRRKNNNNNQSFLTKQSLRQRLLAARIVRESTPADLAAEMNKFWSSCEKGLAFSQGDFDEGDVLRLAEDLGGIFFPPDEEEGGGRRGRVMTTVEEVMEEGPTMEEIGGYRPMWRPRGASPCAVPGVPLISDACGRVPR